MLHPLQSCQNLVMVQTWTSYCFTAWSLIACPGVASNSVLFGPPPCIEALFSKILLLPVWSGAFIFSFGFFYSHCFGRFIAFLRLHHSVCTQMWEERKRSYFIAWGSFISPFYFPPSVMQLFTVGGKHHFVLLKGSQGALLCAASARCASAWWLQWVSRFSIFLPFLCIPTLSLAQRPLSRLPPCLNKSPGSQRWESSCCCLALIWCNDTHNAAQFLPPYCKAEFVFQVKLADVGKGNTCHFFPGCLYCLHCGVNIGGENIFLH